MLTTVENNYFLTSSRRRYAYMQPLAGRGLNTERPHICLPECKKAVPGVHSGHNYQLLTQLLMESSLSLLRIGGFLTFLILPGSETS